MPSDIIGGKDILESGDQLALVATPTGMPLSLQDYGAQVRLRRVNTIL